MNESIFSYVYFSENFDNLNSPLFTEKCNKTCFNLNIVELHLNQISFDLY